MLEADYGEWTGGKIADLAKTDLWKTVQRAPSRARFPSGESLAEMQTRMVVALEEVVARHPGELVVVVSHADPIKAAIAHYTGVHLDLFQRIVVSPASVTVFELGAHGAAMLKCNDTGSLDELLPPPPKRSRRRRRKRSRNRGAGVVSAEIIELDDVDGLGAGAVGEPGKRAFYIQARTERTQLTVLVEKEQVDLLATEAVAFLDQIAEKYPELPFDLPSTQSTLREPTVPLFRARLIGLGFDTERELVLIELRERAAEDDDEDDAERRRRRRRRGLRRAHLRHPRAGARHGRARRRGRRRRPSAVPAVRTADGSLRAPVSSLELTPAELRAALETAELEVVGRMRYSSNATFLVEAKVDGVELAAIYKPRRGERPLWDFAQGTLCQREVAAFELSDALGWDIVPLTVLRDGPLGVGAVQRFVDHDPDEHFFTLRDDHVDRFREFAWFDVLANNTDRKGGHCLHDQANDVIVGIDHGLCFHDEYKLRTVIWEYAGERLPADGRRRRVPRGRRARTRARCTNGSRPCSTTRSSTPSTAAPRCSSPAACRCPATGTAPPGPSSDDGAVYLRL